MNFLRLINSTSLFWRNSKFEALNPKQISNHKSKISNSLVFGFLEFWICLGIRIWDLAFKTFEQPKLFMEV